MEISKRQSVCVVRKILRIHKKVVLGEGGGATSSWRRFPTGSDRGAASVSAHASTCCTSCRTRREVQVKKRFIAGEKNNFY